MKDELDTFCGQKAAGEEVAFKSVPVGAQFSYKGRQFKKINDLGEVFAFCNAVNMEGTQHHFDMDIMVQVWANA